MEPVQAQRSRHRCLRRARALGRPVMQMMLCARVEWSERAADSVCTLSLPCGERVASAEGASGGRGSLAPRKLPSPAGLTRGSILFVKTFLRTGWIAPQLGLARVAQYNAPQVGLTRLAVSSPAMTTAIGGVSSQTLVPPTAGE